MRPRLSPRQQHAPDKMTRAPRRRYKECLTVAQLRELVRYEPDTGKLFWLPRNPSHFLDGAQSAVHTCRRWNSQFAGKEGFTSKLAFGYFSTTIFGKLYLAHRVAWALSFGCWPENQVDHVNGDPSDNRIANLREADCKLNGQNQRLFRTNTSGHVGVTWIKDRQCWRANIKVDGKTIHLGHFKDKAKAIAARLAASPRYGFSEGHGRRA